MSDHHEEIRRLAKEFESCQKILLALGDENRRHRMPERMRTEDCGGVRIGTIAATAHSARPAVSRHIQILKDAGLLNMRREGAKNDYYFDADMDSLNRLLPMPKQAKRVLNSLPDRSGDTCCQK